MTPSISVVIPAYNAAQFLRAALDSVLGQTRQALEILVIDDGSTDETGRLAASIQGVRCLHQRNSGVSTARNRGIDEAKGEFIAFLDADDVWEPDKLGIQATMLRSDQFAYSARIETDDRLQPIRVVQGDRTRPVLEGLLLHGNVVGTPSSVVAPRGALLEAGGFDPKLSMCADWDMWIRLSTRLSTSYLEKPLVLYRIRGDSMSADLKRYESDSNYMIEKAFGLALPPQLASRRREAESRMWEVLGGCYWNQRAFGDALRCAIRSVQRRPTRVFALPGSVSLRMLKQALGGPR